MVTKIRELCRLSVSFGPSIATDVILFSVGRTSDPVETCMGGTPYWPIERPWPHDARGEPLPFLSQINFTRLLDSQRTDAGDLLVIFGRRESGSFEAYWQRIVGDPHQVEIHVPPVTDCMPEFHGHAWSTESYPNWELLDGDDDLGTLEIDRTCRIDDLPFALEFFATQIGGFPTFLLRHGRVALSEGESIIGTVACIVPRPEVEHPLVGNALPLSETEADALTLRFGWADLHSAFGMIYLVQELGSSVRCEVVTL